MNKKFKFLLDEIKYENAAIAAEELREGFKKTADLRGADKKTADLRGANLRGADK